MKKVAILDYLTSNVKVIKLPKCLEGKQSEDIELWLVDNMGYKLSQIEWMSGNLHINLDF